MQETHFAFSVTMVKIILISVFFLLDALCVSSLLMLSRLFYLNISQSNGFFRRATIASFTFSCYVSIFAHLLSFCLPNMRCHSAIVFPNNLHLIPPSQIAIFIAAHVILTWKWTMHDYKNNSIINLSRVSSNERVYHKYHTNGVKASVSLVT